MHCACRFKGKPEQKEKEQETERDEAEAINGSCEFFAIVRLVESGDGKGGASQGKQGTY